MAVYLFLSVLERAFIWRGLSLSETVLRIIRRVVFPKALNILAACGNFDSSSDTYNTL